ncbi:type VI secretion system accessory protein TagJ [Aureimonas jatrophae]|uniref:Type VI secretion system protein ImpE n=1 Tax=Aureimonas jatrophae TaxID=1166073 RepID=A0A1H0N3W5_9HYPH|nr:type VI secretion system accessory protein TagJ [Aureimonas jatrophae]MBB3953024.1 type VI secretion system protein ImpE [Aureimonas jatrophae]SDO87343.1 type VI secretion system protein ImpE [Aureimonas jatrophae]
MTDTGAIGTLLDDNRLGDAMAAAVASLKARPQDMAARLLLIDLLILSGDYARADAQAEIAARLFPGEAVGLARLRGLVRGMEARRLWHTEGAVPAFPGGPSAADQIALRMALALRAGDGADAADRLLELDHTRGSLSVTVDGEAANDLRDLDDRLPHALEAVTDGGAYLWIDWTRIASLTLAPAARPRDLAWRRASLELSDGSQAEVLLPLIYDAPDLEPAERLGRVTEWRDAPGGLVTGRGQRCLLVGETVRALGECVSIEIASAPAETVHG